MRKRRAFVVTPTLASAGPALVALAGALLLAAPARADWLAGWPYRRAIEVSNPADLDLASYPVRIDLGAGFDFGHAAEDGRDLRVTLEDGETEIPLWIESWNPAAGRAWLWACAPSIPAGGATLYIYYGRADADARSDGEATFGEYDGFEDFPDGNPGEWARHPGNPILVQGPPGSWDQSGATFASVIRDESAGEFRMYYHGFSGNVHQIGLATSVDGFHWTKYPGNPIVTPGPDAWDGWSVRVPMVWKEGETYHMIYTGVGLHTQMGYATSSDGIVWTKYAGNPVFNDPTWAHNATENWGVIKADGQYIAWYGAGMPRRCGLAVSTDLLHWTPYQTAPIFDSDGDTGDDRYSQFCPFTFKWGGSFYALVCSYDGGCDYSSLYLYRCPNPYFLEAERQLVRIAHTVGAPDEWDNQDSDTPALLTLDIERSQFFNDELWCYYAGCDGSYWQMGLHRESDIAAALADAPVPEIDWHVEGEAATVSDPARQGAWAKRQVDVSPWQTTWLRDAFTPRSRGAIGAWMRRSSPGGGDFDILLRGENGATRPCVAGLGRDGSFHFWRGPGQLGSGGFEPTGVPWEVNTWYLVTLAFDAAAGSYDFTVHDETLETLLQFTEIAFGEASADLGWIDITTSTGYVGEGFVDDYRLREWCGEEIAVFVGEEQSAADAPAPGAHALASLRLRTRMDPPGAGVWFAHELPGAARVRLELFDPLGRRVATLFEGFESAGTRVLRWDGRDRRGRPVAQGTYLLRLQAGLHARTTRLTIVR